MHIKVYTLRIDGADTNMAIPNDIIIRVNEAAKSALRQGHDVVNATIGMMFEDDGALPSFPQVRAAFSRHVNDEDLVYPSVAGEPLFLERSARWFFNGAMDDEYQQGRLKAIATPGGAGALFAAFLALGKDACVILPRIGWPNYVSQSLSAGAAHDFYDNYDGDHLNLADIREKLSQKVGEYQSVGLLINDPCQNPTGYSLSREEWMAIARFVNEFGGKVKLIIDCAYLNYGPKETVSSLYSVLQSITVSETYLCFSYSKTFSIYGVRLGVAMVFDHDADKAKEIQQRLIKIARSVWSVPNHMAMNAVAELLSEENIPSLNEEIDHNKEVVMQRAKIFFRFAEEYGFHVLPYKEGFFVSIVVEDAVKLVENLMKEDIYIAPINETTVRIALCCLPTSKVERLATCLYNALK